MKSQTVWEYLKSVRSVEASTKLKLKVAFSCEWTQIQQHFVVREWSIWNLKTSRMIEGKTVHISRQLFTCHPISFEGLVLLKFIQSVFECRLIRNVRNRLHFCNLAINHSLWIISTIYDFITLIESQIFSCVIER